MKNWFVAKLVYQIVYGDGKHRPQFEEQWRLVTANDSADAISKATTMA